MPRGCTSAVSGSVPACAITDERMRMLLALCPQLANFIMSIVFFYYLTWNSPEGIVVVIQLTLVALTFVFGFGLWITCKRKFILLKIYTVVLAAFVVVQIIALVALATGSYDECARTSLCQSLLRSELRSPGAGCVCRMGNTILGQVCAVEKASLADARRVGKAKKVAEELDESSWFCCCPESCDQTTCKLEGYMRPTRHVVFPTRFRRSVFCVRRVESRDLLRVAIVCSLG
eukprot:COSAG02_NODE_7738_length_2868_cov_2.198989_1_plen_232_part_00